MKTIFYTLLYFCGIVLLMVAIIFAAVTAISWIKSKDVHAAGETASSTPEIVVTPVPLTEKQKYDLAIQVIADRDGLASRYAALWDSCKPR